MSISILWRKVTPNEGKSIPGLSTDWDAYQSIFGRRNLTKDDEKRLSDLALVSRSEFWNALHEAVEGLDDDEEIAVWAEW